MTKERKWGEEVEGGCAACGDAAGFRLNDKVYCKECYAELRYGTIRNQNIRISGGRGQSGRPAKKEDDGGPWQQNALRDMEDD